MSFGHKHGVPAQAAKVFDIRDLSHDTKSKWFTARTQEVKDYVKQHAMQTTAVGCEDGTHRSRVMVDNISKDLRCSKYHRDI